MYKEVLGSKTFILQIKNKEWDGLFLDLADDLSVNYGQVRFES